MTIRQVKKIINFLSRLWKIRNKKFLLEIIDFLDKNIDKKISFSNEFEFSIIEEKPQIKLLHLNFWQPNLSIQTIKKILRKKERVIISIFQKLSQKFNFCYNLPLLKSFFQFNQKTGLWPIQFGLEYQRDFQPKLKVYLSLEEKYSKRKGKFSFKKFCQYFNLNYRILNKKFKRKNFDTVAIDFFPNNEYVFKFYPLINFNEGLLYRINKELNIYSVKIWKRYPQGLSIDDRVVKDFIKLPKFIQDLIEKNNFKIHYLCKENGQRSFYFR